ncbi:type II toxin-antitoxin system Phd/YefM family antitoxin [Moorena producens]|uniref:type II toxin-antitoxin system Phd/YefM family antitoxin n=1 Tax=Moorena producens TaxID=1155739 RepID=UPI003C776F42
MPIASMPTPCSLLIAILKGLALTGTVIMYQIHVKEAEAKLAELLEAAATGEEVVILGSDGKSFRIVPMMAVQATPKFGSAKGLVKMSEDFDEPLEDFVEYAP